MLRFCRYFLRRYRYLRRYLRWWPALETAWRITWHMRWQRQSGDAAMRRRSQRGQSLAEYALILGLVALVVALIWLLAGGPTIGNIFSGITNGL